MVAPVPLWATLVLGALPLGRFGPEALAGRWLPGVVAGETLLTAALTARRRQRSSAAAGAGRGRRRRAGA